MVSASDVVSALRTGARSGEHLVLWLSGADPEVLEQCPTDRTRFVGLGGAVATTSVVVLGAVAIALHEFRWVPVGTALVLAATAGAGVALAERYALARLWSRPPRDSRRDVVAVALFLPVVALLALALAVPLATQLFAREVASESELAHQRRSQASYRNRLEDQRSSARVRPAPVRADAAAKRQVSGDELRAVSAKPPGNADRVAALTQLWSASTAFRTTLALLALALLCISTLPIVSSVLIRHGQPTMYDQLVVIRSGGAAAARPTPRPPLFNTLQARVPSSRE